MEKGPQLHCSGDELGQGAAPGTLPWSPLLPCGPGKRWQWGGNKGHDGHEQRCGSSCPLRWLCQAPLPPPWGLQPRCHGQEPVGVSPVSPSLRSVQGLDTGHAVLEAVGPEAGDVVIHDLHLPPGVSRVLKQVDLVVGAVLGARAGQGLPPALQSPVATPAQPNSQSGGAGGTSGCRCCGCWTTSPSGGSRPSPARTAPQRRPGARSPATCGTPASGGCSPCHPPGLLHLPHPRLTGQTPPGWSPPSPSPSR